MYFFDYNQPLFRPPSEAHSLIFQITLGCSQNNCTFCGMYKMKNFKLRLVAEIVAEMQSIPAADHSAFQSCNEYPQLGWKLSERS